MPEPIAADGAASPSDDATPPDSLAGLVERWWDDHFPGSPVAQLTAAWNHALAAKEDLKRRLANLAQGGL